MRLLGFPWLVGGLLGALLIAWLSPIAALPYIVQVAALLGLNIGFALILELVLFLIYGSK